MRPCFKPGWLLILLQELIRQVRYKLKDEAKGLPLGESGSAVDCLSNQLLKVLDFDRFFYRIGQ